MALIPVVSTEYRDVEKERKVVNPALKAGLDYEGHDVTEVERRLQQGKRFFVYDNVYGDQRVNETDNDFVAGLWGVTGYKEFGLDDLYVTEKYTEKEPYQVTNYVEVPDEKKKDKPEVRYVFGGNSSTQKQSAATTTTQQGKQDQGSEQNQSNDSAQHLSGQGNVALVVTPNAESAQQLESQAFGSASQTQQVEVASQASADSAQTLDFSAVAATYHVAPVINISADDVYNAESSSTRNYQRTFSYDVGDSTAVLVAGAVCCALYFVYRFLTKRHDVAIAAATHATATPATSRARKKKVKT